LTDRLEIMPTTKTPCRVCGTTALRVEVQLKGAVTGRNLSNTQ
jgi:hypothetical protein